MSYIEELELKLENGSITKGDTIIGSYTEKSVRPDPKLAKELGLIGKKRTEFIKEIKEAIASHGLPPIPVKEVAVKVSDDGSIKLLVSDGVVATYSDQLLSVAEDAPYSVGEEERQALIDLATGAIASVENELASDHEVVDYQEDRVTGGLIVFDGCALRGIDPDMNKKAVTGTGKVSLVFNHPKKGCVEKEVAKVAVWKVELNVELLYKLGFSPNDIAAIGKQINELYCYGAKASKERLSQKRRTEKNLKRKELREKIYNSL